MLVTGEVSNARRVEEIGNVQIRFEGDDAIVMVDRQRSIVDSGGKVFERLDSLRQQWKLSEKATRTVKIGVLTVNVKDLFAALSSLSDEIAKEEAAEAAAKAKEQAARLPGRLGQ